MLIGTRVLHIRGEAGPIEVPVRMFVPSEDDHSWACRYEIDWPDGPWRSAAWGVDALQALHLAMNKIASELYSNPYHEQGLLSWGEGGGYGFPITKNGRDILVGYDKEFDG